jgi:ribonuclease D
MTDSHAHTWIDTPAGLAPLAEALAAAPWTALDTEANSMHAYRERTCLMQVNAGGRLFLVDTLALMAQAGWAPLTSTSHCRGLDALIPGLGRSDRPLWLHGGEYDCAVMRRDFGIELGGVWDTQQAASLLGWEKTGYGACVDAVCAIKLDKAYSQYDWATRPLEAGALAYALDDVIHLPLVAERLRGEIATADLVEEHAIANAAVAASGWDGGFDPAGFWRIKGIREIPRDRLPLLAALYAWRDVVAKLADRPPGRMVNSELLLGLTRWAPTSFQSLKRCGVKGWLMAEHGDALIAVIKQALESPAPLPPPDHVREVDEAEVRRERRLKDWRQAEAQNRTVPLQVVLPAKALEHLKRYGAGDLGAVPQLGAKRQRLYGEVLQRLCS